MLFGMKIGIIRKKQLLRRIIVKLQYKIGKQYARITNMFENVQRATTFLKALSIILQMLIL